MRFVVCAQLVLAACKSTTPQPSPLSCSAPDECLVACASGQAESCLRAGDLAADGDVELELEDATASWTRACELGIGAGCERLACVLLGDGQLVAAEREIDRACERGACGLAHSCADPGIACSPEAACKRAAPATSWATCEVGDAAACFRAGEEYERGRKASQASNAYGRACAGHIAAACTHVGKSGDAESMYRARCARDRASACESLRGLTTIRDVNRNAAASIGTWQVVAGCSGDLAQEPILAAHCADLDAAIDTWRRTWLAAVSEFFAARRPANVPRTVIYPFGGGDLLTALAVFPDADVYTTISLEPALEQERELPPLQAHRWFQRWRLRAKRLLATSYNTTRSLEQTGVYSLAMLGIRAHGCVRQDGASITFAADGKIRRVGVGREHFELEFKCGNRVKVWRHIQADLAAPPPEVTAHLARFGDVAALVKASGFLLWQPRFEVVRNYLLDHARWIVSDISGIHADDARARGRRVTTYGPPVFPFPTGDPKREAALQAGGSEPGPPFAFGYGGIVTIE
jgi:hypothetical protein